MSIHRAGRFFCSPPRPASGTVPHYRLLAGVFSFAPSRGFDSKPSTSGRCQTTSRAAIVDSRASGATGFGVQALQRREKHLGRLGLPPSDSRDAPGDGRGDRGSSGGVVRQRGSRGGDGGHVEPFPLATVQPAGKKAGVTDTWERWKTGVFGRIPQGWPESRKPRKTRHLRGFLLVVGWCPGPSWGTPIVLLPCSPTPVGPAHLAIMMRRRGPRYVHGEGSRINSFRGSITRLRHWLSTLRRPGRPDTTQDSLPAAGQTLPDGLDYPQGSDERFRGVSYISTSFPKFNVAQGRS